MAYGHWILFSKNLENFSRTRVKKRFNISREESYSNSNDNAMYEYLFYHNNLFDATNEGSDRQFLS